MPFTFEIQEFFTVKVKGYACLIGNVISGKIEAGDIIDVPTQQGTTVHGVIIEINEELASSSIESVEVGHAKRVGLLVTRMGREIDNITTGRAESYDRAAYTAEERARIEALPKPPKTNRLVEFLQQVLLMFYLIFALLFRRR